LFDVIKPQRLQANRDKRPRAAARKLQQVAASATSRGILDGNTMTQRGLSRGRHPLACDLYRIIHADKSGQWLIASSAHAVDFSAWQVVHGLAILN
jgi:hypothetical protein